MKVLSLLVCVCFVISCESRSTPPAPSSSDAGSTAAQGYIEGKNEDLKVLKHDLQVEATGREGALDKQIGQ